MINIFIADDSIAYRDRIEKRLMSDANNKLIGLTRLDGEVVRQLRDLKPDVLVIDLGYDGKLGFEILGQVLKAVTWKLHVIGLMSDPKLAHTAWALGCDDTILKDVSAAGSLVKDCDQVAHKIAEIIGKNVADREMEETKKIQRLVESFVPSVVVMASSTGGPMALEKIIVRLGAAPKIPIIIVQHMPELATKSFAQHLATVSQLDVREVVDQEEIVANVIYLAPGNFHLHLKNDGRRITAKIDQMEKLHSVRPAADYLFKSAAEIYGKGCLGIVLTGMGQDAADGAVAIKRLGGKVMIQDRKSSAVWGMPGAVHYLGAYDAMASIDTIASTLARMAVRPDE